MSVHKQPHYDGPLHMMERLGGSFVRALAAAYYQADMTNRIRLKAAFNDYFSRYEGLFEIHRAERESAKAQGEQG